jgi:hypothetical protein
LLVEEVRLEVRHHGVGVQDGVGPGA